MENIHVTGGVGRRKKGILTFRPHSDLTVGTDEGLEQQYLFDWIKLQEGHNPIFARIYHVPNGGKRSKGVAGKLKAQGVRPGVPDICFPVARGGYNGLYIELKVIKGNPTEEQRAWLLDLEQEGNMACVCYGWQLAADVISAYASGQLKRGNKA